MDVPLGSECGFMSEPVSLHHCCLWFVGKSRARGVSFTMCSAHPNQEDQGHVLGTGQKALEEQVFENNKRSLKRVVRVVFLVKY